MKRAEFIETWVTNRRAFCDAEVKAGRMRLSESVANTMDDEKTAKKLWRRYRMTLIGMTPDSYNAWLRKVATNEENHQSR